MTDSPNTILQENKAYWTVRAPGYSDVNRTELSTGQRQKWKQCLLSEAERRFPFRAPEELQVLDAGTGPGFFAVILAELGFCVTAIDLTPAMLEEARENAGSLAPEIRFLEMNAEALSFPSHTFDLVISRNLTWNLPHPKKAYREWMRVLKPGGLLLNFDANWYSYLFDEKAKNAYQQDRSNTAEKGMKDENIGDHFDVMEDIARRVPLSNIRRPAWDLRILTSLRCSASADEEIWKSVWSEEEKTNFASTPLFLVKAVKQ